MWDSLEEVFDPVDELEEDMRARLWRSGFVRVEGPGLMAEDRYVLPDEIASVSGDRVDLNITKDDMIRR